MVKTILGLLVKVLESKLVKSGLEKTILQNKNYITVAKQVWSIVDENFRISKTVEEKLESKAEQFDKLLLAKFPELSKEDAAELRQSIAGEVNSGKEAVLDNSELLKQLQQDNANLKQQLTTVTEQLQQVQSLITVPVEPKTDKQATA